MTNTPPLAASLTTAIADTFGFTTPEREHLGGLIREQLGQFAPSADRVENAMAAVGRYADSLPQLSSRTAFVLRSQRKGVAKYLLAMDAQWKAIQQARKEARSADGSARPGGIASNGEAAEVDATREWLKGKVAQAFSPPSPSFQSRVAPWMQACFGPAISADTVERNHRFLEEALELVQACGATREECLQLVDYVYGRPVGEPSQEVGGVMVTLAALCLANGLDMHQAGETELARIWTKVEQIRAKQAGKPKGSVVPQAVRSTASADRKQEGESGDECFAPYPAS